MADTACPGAVEMEVPIVQLRLPMATRRDPWWDLDGKGARRHRTRVRIEGAVAFVLAVVACGLTAAAWLQLILPFLHGFGIG